MTSSRRLSVHASAEAWEAAAAAAEGAARAQRLHEAQAAAHALLLSAELAAVEQGFHTTLRALGQQCEATTAAEAAHSRAIVLCQSARDDAFRAEAKATAATAARDAAVHKAHEEVHQAQSELSAS